MRRVFIGLDTLLATTPMQKRIRLRKIVVVAAAGALVLLAVVVITLALTLDTVVRRTVVTVGTKVTGVDVELDAVELSLFNGEGSLRGFALGNPEGYTSPTCIQFDEASLAIEPASLWSDKVVVRHLRLISPVITFEGGVDGNNFGELRRNISSREPDAANGAASGDEPDDRGSSRHLQINELTLTGARLNVIIRELGGQPQAMRLPDIQLRNLGMDPDGVSSGELVRLALDRILHAALEEWSKSGADTNKPAEAALKDMHDSDDDDLKRAVRGMLDLIKNLKE